MSKKNYYDEIYYLTDVREKLSKNTPYRFLMQIEGQDSIELVKLSEYEVLQQRIDKATKELKDTSVDMPSNLLIEVIDYAVHILQGENK